jgi:hypothetical protein
MAATKAQHERRMREVKERRMAKKLAKQLAWEHFAWEEWWRVECQKLVPPRSLVSTSGVK